jgi:hypothetical protein
VAALVAAAGCARGRTDQFPPPLDPSQSAEVVVMRNNNTYGSAGTVPVVLDGFTIAHLWTGQHVRFRVPPGTHAVGVAEAPLSVHFDVGRSYYFLITPTPKLAFETEQLEEPAARERLLASNEVK